MSSNVPARIALLALAALVLCITQKHAPEPSPRRSEAAALDAAPAARPEAARKEASPSSTSAPADALVAEATSNETCDEPLDDLVHRAKREGRSILLAPGTHCFRGDEGALEGVELHRAPGARVLDARGHETLVFYRDRLIGVAHNPEERKGRAASGGWLAPPPRARPAPKTSPVLIAHWYNDFGLQSTLAGHGGITWYDWSWNHHGAERGRSYTPRDPSRHPLIGFYRGDDPNVLGWITYWLAEHGVGAVNLTSSDRIDLDRWQEPSNPRHWLNVLFERTANFAALSYILWGPSYRRGDTPELLAAEWSRLAAIYQRYPNHLTTTHEGAAYPVVYLWDLESLYRGLEPGGDGAVTSKVLRSAASAFRAAGFPGVAIFARKAGLVSRDESAEPRLSHSKLLSEGVLVYFAGYSRDYTGRSGATVSKGSDRVGGLPAHTFVVGDRLKLSHGFDDAEVVVSGTGSDWIRVSRSSDATATGVTVSPADFPTLVHAYGSEFARWPAERRALTVSNVMTSAESKPPHPSRWTTRGSSPRLYREWLSKSARLARELGMAAFLQIYNVSEWAEAGPGLIPNMRDGFDYLEATREVASEL